GINVALGRESASEAFHNAGINFIGEVAGRVGANQISRMYSGTLPDGRPDPNGRRLNFWTHKGAHGIVGLGLGALHKAILLPARLAAWWLSWSLILQ
ncbi:hypothetical protein, partial [Candidatus Paracaedibacter symbiosus]|uniref:hypothetical protein n=1 Tax=Candidatus Paracaedibacter symbiosus TaxID=244582 RepID=UPI000509BC2D